MMDPNASGQLEIPDSINMIDMMPYFPIVTL